MNVMLHRDWRGSLVPEPQSGDGDFATNRNKVCEKEREVVVNVVYCLRRRASRPDKRTPPLWYRTACLVVHPGSDAATAKARCKTQAARSHGKVRDDVP
jgi:hypothetical protein